MIEDQAFDELVNENAELRAEVAILRKQVAHYYKEGIETAVIAGAEIEDGYSAFELLRLECGKQIKVNEDLRAALNTLRADKDATIFLLNKILDEKNGELASLKIAIAHIKQSYTLCEKEPIAVVDFGIFNWYYEHRMTKVKTQLYREAK